MLIETLTGTTGKLLSTASVLTLLLLMAFMSLRLQRRYRSHRVYRLLNTALAFIFAQYVITLAITLNVGAIAPWPNISAIMLQMLSFIIINFVVLELYTKPRKADHFLFIVLLALTFAAASVELFRSFGGAAIVKPNGFRLLSLDFYALVVNYICIQRILPRIGQQGKYGACLAVFFIYILAESINHYLFQNAVPALTIVTYILPVVYYTLLFMLLFEWVIERLQSVYVSSITDGLTGMYNRQHFMRKTRQYVERGHNVAFLFCDIDNFKLLNDTEGHRAADQVLKQVAGILIDETEGIGTAGRYGGEELVAAVAHPKVKPQDIAETVRARVEKETSVTVSIGWSVINKRQSAEEAVRQADEAMYHSKMTGKNKVTSYKSISRTRGSSAASLENDDSPTLKAT
ncbi:diguanylate cyclase [Paenibacillus tarimensis]